MMPVCVSVTVSLAFGTTAPVASVTVPSNVAFTAWDQPTAAAAAINKERMPSKRRLDVFSLLAILPTRRGIRRRRDMVINSFSYSEVQGSVQPSVRHTRSIYSGSELRAQQNLPVLDRKSTRLN